MKVRSLALCSFGLVVFALTTGCSTEVDEDLDSTSDALACRDLSGNYRVASAPAGPNTVHYECAIGGGVAANNATVVLSQPPGCSPQVTLTATVSIEQTWSPLPPRFVGGYDMCALARFDAGSHGGVAQYKPEWHCEDPLPPLPPPIVKQVSQTVARSKVQDWGGSRIDIGTCTLIRTGGASNPPPPPPPLVGPTAKLSRASFLRTATLGYDDYLSAGTIVGLSARPSTVSAKAGFTWVTWRSKSGFIADYDLVK